MEENKIIKLTIGSIVKKMDKQTIRFDHPLQRMSDLWSNLMVSNLVSDILQDNPLPSLVFAEQVVNGMPIIWDLDGKQRCSSVYMFAKNQHKISKRVTRYMISYFVPVLNEIGEIEKDDDGFPIYNKKEVDIRGKKFDDLPKELQDKFLDYSFEIVKYLDCSSDNIAYHIARYNDGKPMNMSQKGITRIGIKNAENVKHISAMDFFEDSIGKYSAAQFKNGTINRVIVESVMAINYFDNWSKDFGDICEFLKENAKNEDFEKLREIVDRLTEIVNESTGKLFDQRDSLLWFTLFSKFEKLHLDDEKFNDFLQEVVNGQDVGKDEPMTGICAKEINGIAYDMAMNSSSTKDRTVIESKLDFLTALMCDFLGVDITDIDSEENENIELLEDFKQNFVTDGMAISTLMLISNSPFNSFDDETLENMEKWFAKNGNKALLDDCLYYKSFVIDAGIEEDNINLPLFTYGVNYIIDKEIDKIIDIDEWLAEFKVEAFKNIEVNEDYKDIDSSVIALKQSEIVNNIIKFKEKKENCNETI